MNDRLLLAGVALLATACQGPDNTDGDPDGLSIDPGGDLRVTVTRDGADVFTSTDHVKERYTEYRTTPQVGCATAFGWFATAGDTDVRRQLYVDLVADAPIVAGTTLTSLPDVGLVVHTDSDARWDWMVRGPGVATFSEWADRRVVLLEDVAWCTPGQTPGTPTCSAATETVTVTVTAADDGPYPTHLGCYDANYSDPYWAFGGTPACSTEGPTARCDE